MKIRESNKLHYESYVKLEVKTISWITNPSSGKNPKRHLPERFIGVTIIRYSNDATETHIFIFNN